MDLIALLEDEFFEKHFKTDTSYIGELRACFFGFQELVAAVSPSEGVGGGVLADLRADIGRRCDGILLALECRLSGLPHRAYDEFTAALQDCLRGLVQTDLNTGSLFRLRNFHGDADADVFQVGRKELRELPQSLRHKTAAYRYSLAGSPCLYLSGSSLCSWLELDQPPMERLVGSCFEPRRALRVLNLDRSILRLSTRLSVERLDLPFTPEAERQQNLEILSALRAWPLITACSFRRGRARSAFYEEYVIPQLVTQWASDPAEGVDCIAYRSTKNPSALSSSIYTNYVFPLKEFTRGEWAFEETLRQRNATPFCLLQVTTEREILEYLTKNGVIITAPTAIAELHPYTRTLFYYFDKYMETVPPDY